MKKSRSIWLYLLTAILSVTLLLGSFNVFAFADDGSFNNGDELFAGKITERVVLGSEVAVPQPNDGVTLTVTAPDGVKVIDGLREEIGDFRVKASKLGVYTVEYSADTNREDGTGKKLSYTYNILCYEQREYSIRVNTVEKNFIPTYVATGAKVNVPDFDLVYTNNDDEVVVVKDAVKDMSFTVGSADRSESAEAGVFAVLTTKRASVMTITLRAKISADSNKWYSEDIVVNVQDNFEDTTAPTLSAVSLSTSANVNTKVQLPAMNPSDDYSSRTFVEISVKDPDGNNVKTYEVNDYGYAMPDKEGAEVVFDNSTAEGRVFYPVKLGAYKVSYRAFDGFNWSQTNTYTVTVSDKLAPQIVDTHSDEIPTQWGINSVKKSDGTEANNASDISTAFKMPFPEVVDNYYGADGIKVTIQLDNPNRTIAKWEGKVSEFANGVALTSTYAKYFKDEKGPSFKDTGLDFDFNLINFEQSTLNGKTGEKVGDWKLTYTVKDDKGSATSKKEFVIKVVENFTDTEAPVIDENIDLPKYVLITGEDDTFEVPAISVSDNYDTDMSIVYSMTSAGVTAGGTVVYDGVTYEVISEYDELDKSGATYDIFSVAGKYYIGISEDNHDYALLLSGSPAKVTLNFSAKDDVGNSSAMKATEIDVLYADKLVQTALHAEFNIEDKGGRAGEAINLGGFEISNVENREYTGFELSVTDPKGNEIPFTAYTYTDKDTKNIVVRDITVTSGVEGSHILAVKLFDISGVSKAYAYTFEVTEKSSTEVPINYAAVMTETTELGEAVLLETDYTITRDDGYTSDDYVLMRRINGERFALMGDEFTVYESVSYTVDDYAVRKDLLVMEINSLIDELKNSAHNRLLGSYSTVGAATAEHKIEVHGVIESHYERTNSVDEGVYEEGAYIELPAISGYTSSGEIGEISVTVDKDGEEVKVYKKYRKIGEEGFELKRANVVLTDEEKETLEFTGNFVFPAEDDGEYEIRIVSKASVAEATKNYTITVGDVSLPSFTLESAQNSAKVSDKFTVPTITFAEGASVESITLNIKDPTGTVISDASVTVTYSVFNKQGIKLEYEFESSGTYTVECIVKGNNGKEAKEHYTINVVAPQNNWTKAQTTLMVVLIIVGVLLLVGLIVYFVRFRKVRK